MAEGLTRLASNDEGLTIIGKGRIGGEVKEAEVVLFVALVDSGLIFVSRDACVACGRARKQETTKVPLLREIAGVFEHNYIASTSLTECDAGVFAGLRGVSGFLFAFARRQWGQRRWLLRIHYRGFETIL